MNFEVESLPLFEVSHPFFKQAIALFSQQLLRTYFHVILDVAFIVPIELFLVRRFIGFIVSPYYMTPEPLVYLRGLGRIAMISTDRALARQFTTLFDFANQLRIHPYPRKATFIGTTFVVWSIAYLFLLCCPDWIFMLSWIYLNIVLWRWVPLLAMSWFFRKALALSGKAVLRALRDRLLPLLLPTYRALRCLVIAVGSAAELKFRKRKESLTDDILKRAPPSPVDRFQHKPLGNASRQIRLLRIRSGLFTARCDLVARRCSWWRLPRYTAISWRWPPTDKPKTHALRIDGKDLGISETIFNALEVLMPIYGTAYIWIDAVCIIKKV